MKTRNLLWRITIAFLLILSACSLPEPAVPGAQTMTPEGSTPLSPTPVPENRTPLPPVLVETDPPAGSQIPLQAPLTLYFSEPMDHASVESALSAQPALSGQYTWPDESTVVFTSDSPLSPASDLTITVAATARAANGLELTEPVTLTFSTADELSLVQTLPEDGAAEAVASSAVVAAFNQPVVPLGADSATLPAAFTLKPQVDGKGEWINTSTYIFYPDPALAGGLTYTASLNPGLSATSGSGLESTQGWSFTVAMPKLISLEPSSEEILPLDAALKLTFNQPMEPASVEANLSLTGPAGSRVAGKYSWNENHSVMTFTPSALLERDTNYTLLLSEEAQGRGGTFLGQHVLYYFRTTPNFRVTETKPVEGGSGQYVTITFSAPLQDEDVTGLISISPEPFSKYVYTHDDEINIGGDFASQTAYTVTISAGLKDRWGQALGQNYTLHFFTPPAEPRLTLPMVGTDTYFIRSDDPRLYVQAVNVSSVELQLASIPLETFLRLKAPEMWQERQDYHPADPLVWKQPVSLSAANSNEPVELDLAHGGGSLPTGIYNLELQAPEAAQRDRLAQRTFLVVSNINLTFKASQTDALVWALDMRTNTPIANAPVNVYDVHGYPLASGMTGADGIWKASLATDDKAGGAIYAVLGQPGDEIFSLGMTGWNSNVSPWNFGLSFDRQEPHDEVYIYTDRPIYRPGQTVYFRAVVRQFFDGIYSDPTLSSLPLTLSDGFGQTWTFDLPLSDYGTAHGIFAIPATARPGTYTITNTDLSLYFYFDVANYRKPEINLSVEFDPAEILKGESLRAAVNARYFFDAPSGDLPVHWVLYAARDYFSIPGYRVGTFTDSWLNQSYEYWYGGFGEQIAEGDAVTKADGTLLLEFAASDLPEADNRQTLTLEVTAQDESGQPVSARATADLHPADFYIGIRPDLWVGQAGDPIGFEIYSADWAKAPSASRTLRAEFQSVTWQRKVLTGSYGIRNYQFTPIFTPAGSADFVTGADGKARLEFTPAKPGTYLLDVSGEGTRSQALVWVGGAEQAVWPNLPYDRVRLTTDRDSYLVGQTAQVFIPNPLGAGTRALVSVERGTIRSAQVFVLDGGSLTFSLPLTEAEAPNIYISATLIGPQGFRQGYVELEVKSDARTLNVSLTGDPQRAGPRDPVTFDLRVTDSTGKPVKGEFSLAVVDLAALALADPNSLEIVPAFNQPQPLGVITSISLAAVPERGMYFSDGRGGGGGDGGAMSVVRENFPDTAYWNAEVITDSDGRASVSVTLPDNLTTWQVDVRGLTRDTLVGQAQMQIVSTKDLLVRPVTPRFLVVGDRTEVGAVIHNNTGGSLEVDVSLQAKDFSLDEGSKPAQKVTVPAGGRKLVTWWGTAQDAESVDLVFAAQSGDLTDASRPNNGPLPVLHYVAPQTFNTAGILSDSGSRLELVSLPRSYDPTGGNLSVELSPSLAATLLSGLDAIGEPPETCSNEFLLSYILPNLEVYRAFQDAGLVNLALQERVDTKLQTAIDRLVAHQNPNDYGWNWYTPSFTNWEVSRSSDPYLTASILLGLDRASQAGFRVNGDVLSNARKFLAATDLFMNGTDEEWELDLLAFESYVMQETGGVSMEPVRTLYGEKDRLSPWAQALLALTIASASPGEGIADELLSNLETTAIRSATGAHWESEPRGWRNPSTTLVTSAMVIYALARHDPASPLLADAVRYLSAHRSAAGLWGTPHETAWVILALNAYMVGTGGYAADFSFDARLNSQQLAQGLADGPSALTPVLASVPVASLYADSSNALTIERGEGNGSLYYRAALQVYQPVEQVKALDAGFGVERLYYPYGCGKDCKAIQSTQLEDGARLTVRLTLTLPHDAYYLQVDDFVPAGAEILDTTLKTSQQGEGSGTDVSLYDPENPYARGWGWWYFASPQVFDDHISWSADYLPAGTYILSYTLIPMQAGQYHLIPAHAWMTFFPEVQGTSAGGTFEIKR